VVRADQQIPRNALAWIIVAQFALLLPHLGRIPVWISFVYLVVAGHRIMVYQGRWWFPGTGLKALLALSCFIGIFYSYRSLIGLEPTVALLLAAFALKLIEVARRKDAYLLLFLGYFVCVTEFLFSQDLSIAIYMLVVVVIITTALIALHQPEEHAFTRSSLRRALVILAQSFPLMLVLFLVFPRIGPLWSVPLMRTSAKSGVSDFMAPGDISSLSGSDEVAFRVQFDGEVPPHSELYWRGLVFSRLEGAVWRGLRWSETPVIARTMKVPERLAGRRVSYSILQQPSQQNWLYSMRYATTDDPGIIPASDYRLHSPAILETQKSYEVTSWIDVPIELELNSWRREVETRLPETGNPRTRELAQRLYNESGGGARAYAKHVLKMFTEEEYFYTLRPPLLAENGMDQFLFETRQGFCEHYAAAFVYMMRAAGIPSRVVAGYQGGEINPVNGTVIVHQFDAHAWAEIWAPGEGWVRVDPTAAVAPERIDWGLETAMRNEGSFLADSPLSALRWRNVAWVNLARLRLDALNYRWQRMVLNFDSDDQMRLLDGLLGGVTPVRIAFFVSVIWAMVLIPVVLYLVRGRKGKPLDQATRLYLNFCRKLQKVALPRSSAEAPGDYAVRIASQRPDLSADINEITQLYYRLNYRGDESERGLQLLRKRVREFHPGRRESLKPV
jgi:transglutaminase-like putative cysteine protease